MKTQLKKISGDLSLSAGSNKAHKIYIALDGAGEIAYEAT